MIQLFPIFVEEFEQLLATDNSAFIPVQLLKNNIGSQYLQLFSPSVQNPCTFYNSFQQMHEKILNLTHILFFNPKLMFLLLQLHNNLIPKISKRNNPSSRMIKMLKKIIQLPIVASHPPIQIFPHISNRDTLLIF